MKKIFILLFFPVALFGQKISNLPAGGEPDADDIMPVVVNGTTSKVNKGELLRSVNDSVVNLTTNQNILWNAVFGDPTPAAELQFFYKFEGDSLDETGYNRTFVLSPDFNYIDPTETDINFAGNFDTITRYVTTPSFNQTSSFVLSLDAFIYNDSSGNRTIAAGDGWRLASSGDTIKFITPTDSTYCVDAFDIDTVQFRPTHILVTSAGEIWVDGVEQTTAGSIAGGYDVIGTVVLGQTKTGTEPFYGYEDNVRFYTGTMTDAEKVTDNESSDRYTQPDDTNPTINTAAVGIPIAIIIKFSEPIYNFVEDSLIEAMTYYANDSLITIDSISYYSSGWNLAIYTDSITAGAALEIFYEPDAYSGLRDWAGNILRDVFGRIVENNYVVPFTNLAVAHWSLDGNGLDDIGGYTMLDTGLALGYSSTIFFEGTQSVQLNGSSHKLWIPSSYDSNPDILTITGRTRLTSNASNWTMVENFTGTAYKIEWRAPGNDIRVYVGAAFAEATNIGGSSAATPINEWRTWGVEITKSSGAVLIYVDGVDETDDGTAAGGADLSGPFRMYGVTRGFLDDMTLYEAALTATEHLAINATPGHIVQRQQDPDPDPPDPVGDVVDTLFIWDFEDNDIGYYNRATARSNFNSNNEARASWNYHGFTYTSQNQLQIIDVDVKIDGAATTTQALQATKAEGVYESVQTPLSMRCPLAADPNNTDVYAQADFKTPHSAWQYVTENTGGKTIGLWAGYKGAILKNVFTDNARWGEGNANYHIHSGYFGWPPKDENELTPHWLDSDGSNLHIPHGSTTDSMYRVTVRMVTGVNGFTEYFYNGLLVGTNYDHGKDMTGWVIDMLKVSYTWNKPPEGGVDIPMVMDNFFVYRYKQDWDDGYWMQRSPVGRILYSPIPTYR